MTHSLRGRQEGYENDFDYTITKRIPIGVKITLKNYKRLTQNLDKPFSEDFSELMGQTSLFIISQIQDAVFCYYHNDEIIIILKNDKGHDYQPWHSNSVQKIASSVSSIATLGFLKNSELFDGLDLTGDALFSAHVFILPYLNEAFNYLIFKQSVCMNKASYEAALYELEKKFGKVKALDLLKDASYQDKVDVLLKYCGIDFLDMYDPSYIYGIAVYKIPVISHTRSGDVTKNKWHIDYEIPNFVYSKDFVSAILVNGADIYRASDLDLDDYE
jgi:tRNA(His) 5'-end guanylyltransferase